MNYFFFSRESYGGILAKTKKKSDNVACIENINYCYGDIDTTKTPGRLGSGV